MTTATYWPAKPNNTTWSVDGVVYTHRDCNGNAARLLGSALWSNAKDESPTRYLANVWAVRNELGGEKVVVSPQGTLEFVEGSANQREAPSDRWAHVKVDTPMWVSTGPEDNVFVALFSHAEGDTVYTFEVGDSSADNRGQLSLWEHVTLAPTGRNI